MRDGHRHDDGGPPVLAAHGVCKHFGGVRALHDVSLTVRDGSIHCVIGPNGAGKTTLFEVLSGTAPATRGRIEFAGRDITRLRADQISRLGLVRTFQAPRVISTMSVKENLLLGISGRRAGHRPARLLRRRHDDVGEAREIADHMNLADSLDALPVDLNHGARKRLQMGLSLTCAARVLLLDEPTAGMNAAETEEMSAIIREVVRSATVVVIEHDLDFVRRMADWVSVLDRGMILCEGTVEDVEADARVREAYTGARVDD